MKLMEEIKRAESAKYAVSQAKLERGPNLPRPRRDIIARDRDETS